MYSHTSIFTSRKTGTVYLVLSSKPSPKKFHNIFGASSSLEYEVREHTCGCASLPYFVYHVITFFTLCSG